MWLHSQIRSALTLGSAADDRRGNSCDTSYFWDGTLVNIYGIREYWKQSQSDRFSGSPLLSAGKLRLQAPCLPLIRFHVVPMSDS